MQRKKSPALVYLIHFERPYHHARHYMGTTTDLDFRMRQHAGGVSRGGAHLMQAVTRAGINWWVARTWAGGVKLEKRLKAAHNGSIYCPVCKEERLTARLFDRPPELLESWLD